MLEEEIRPVRMSRRGFLGRTVVILGGGAAAVACGSSDSPNVNPTASPQAAETATVASSPIAVSTSPFEKGAVFKARVEAESFSFHPASKGLPGLVEKFATAVASDTGENVRPLLANLKYGYKPENGICSGVAAYQALRNGPTSEAGTLGDITFQKGEILSLGGLLHLGDADKAEEGYPGDPKQAGFFHYMLSKYLLNGQGLVVDFAANPDQVFRHPVDMVSIDLIRDEKDLQGWHRLEVTLRCADYSDPGFSRPVFSERQPGFRFQHIAYQVDNLLAPTQGKYLRWDLAEDESLRSIRRPDPTRYWVSEGPNKVGTRSLDDNLSSQELLRLGAYKMQGVIFNKTMVRAFNQLAGEGWTLIVRPDDPYARPE